MQVNIDNVGIVVVLEDEMVDVHMTVDTADNHVPILMHPQGIFLPARLVPIPFANCPGWRYMSDKNGFHPAFA